MSLFVKGADQLRRRLAEGERPRSSKRSGARGERDRAVPELPEHVAEMLARLRNLLVGVPFQHLVPDSRMLPPESIRFFHLDQAWTEQLVAGALSVGGVSTRTRTRLSTSGEGLRASVAARSPELRRSSKKVAVTRGTEVTGFLLRSELVSGWPGMQVRAYAQSVPAGVDPESSAPRVPLLRLERLSPTVLIALFAGAPRLICLEEPHHGLQLGFTRGAGSLTLVPRARDGAPVPAAAVQVPMRASAANVVDVAALAARLQASAGAHPNLPKASGAAVLALHLVKAPYRQRFDAAAPPGAHP